MDFVCTSSNYLDEKQEQLLKAKQIKIIHKAKLSPIYIINTCNLESIKVLGLFKTVRESRVFKFADVNFYPHFDHSPLLKNLNAVGWGIKVAVIDSGIRSSIVSVAYEKDYTGYGQNIVIQHGTHVAQIIKYYASGSQILSFKIGHGGNDIDEGHIFRALDKAIDKKADIINLSIEDSLGCFGQCELCSYVNLVANTGITVVAAAGNQGNKRGNTISCPGAAERAVTVGGINPNGEIDTGSGKGIPGFNKPNLLAPSTVKLKTGSEIHKVSGTSFATPVVSGILAALFSKFNDRHYVITKLFDTCESLGLPKHKQGFGVINLSQLVEVLKNDSILSSSSGQK